MLNGMYSLSPCLYQVAHKLKECKVSLQNENDAFLVIWLQINGECLQWKYKTLLNKTDDKLVVMQNGHSSLVVIPFLISKPKIIGPHLHLRKSCYIQQGFTKKTKLIPCKLRNKHIVREIGCFLFLKVLIFHQQKFSAKSCHLCLSMITVLTTGCSYTVAATKVHLVMFRCLVWY